MITPNIDSGIKSFQLHRCDTMQQPSLERMLMRMLLHSMKSFLNVLSADDHADHQFFTPRLSSTV